MFKRENLKNRIRVKDQIKKECKSLLSKPITEVKPGEDLLAGIVLGFALYGIHAFFNGTHG
jgi:hypothetical protein